ncbi:unnamed protein product [Candidula unifasciata]|uniref:Uncharacterized protein n=1 Tax=Candidula unifasciata TaxID=100452 RepID=A0A8S4A1L9_9EUPU|nr:unnamed protein product [Candidula unifasciata]
MEINKHPSYDQPPLQDYPSEDVFNELLPPPYTDEEPPAYSTVVESSSTAYTTAPVSLDYMSKLPYGDSVNSSHQSPLERQSYYQEPFGPQMSFQQFSNQETFNPQITSPIVSAPDFPQETTRYSSNLLPGPQRTTSITPHKDLLQPTPSRLIETKKTRRGNIKSHIKDLETGKEYFIKEKISKGGNRSKTVVKEVGGPKTVVRETPKRTIVCQKKK